MCNLLNELETLVDAQRTRLDLLEEEANHFRTSHNSLKKEYDRMKGQFEQLAQKLAKPALSDRDPDSNRVKPPRINQKLSSFNA